MPQPGDKTQPRETRTSGGGSVLALTSEQHTMTTQRDIDAPQSASHEGRTAQLQRALVSALAEAAGTFLQVAPKLPPRNWLRTAAIGLLSGVTFAGGTYAVTQPQQIVVQQPSADECETMQPLAQYILHQALKGEPIAQALETRGLADIAVPFRELTDVNQLPNTLAICVLRAKQAQRAGGNNQ
jgi:hypothetical protein